MKAQELRIGNLVHPDKTCDIVRVIAEDFKDTTYLRGIPLTEEWLRRFGFTGRRDFMWKNNCGVQIIDGTFYFAFKDMGNVLFHSVVEIKYIHRLQNAYYALTNEELILKRIIANESNRKDS